MCRGIHAAIFFFRFLALALVAVLVAAGLGVDGVELGVVVLAPLHTVPVLAGFSIGLLRAKVALGARLVRVDAVLLVLVTMFHFEARVCRLRRNRPVYETKTPLPIP